MISPETYPCIGTLTWQGSRPFSLHPPQNLDRRGILLLVEQTPLPEPRVAFAGGALRLAIDGRLECLLNRRLPQAETALARGAVIHAHFRDFVDDADAAFTCQEIQRRGPSWNLR